MDSFNLLIFVWFCRNVFDRRPLGIEGASNLGPARSTLSAWFFFLNRRFDELRLAACHKLLVREDRRSALCKLHRETSGHEVLAGHILGSRLVKVPN